MKFFDCSTAPTPRRVRIFLAEKGMEVERVEVDLRNGEHMTPEFQRINPHCTVPVLQLDDGDFIAESTAICRYLEEIQPDPPLMGVDAKDKAVVEMWDRWMEFDGFMAASETFRNRSKGFKGRAMTGVAGVEQISELAERGQARLLRFFADLDKRLGESEYVAGPRYTIADITAQCTVDFAAWMKLGFSDDQTNGKRWHAAVSARPSASL